MIRGGSMMTQFMSRGDGGSTLESQQFASHFSLFSMSFDTSQFLPASIPSSSSDRHPSPPLVLPPLISIE